jgi:hypothetical protein
MPTQPQIEANRCNSQKSTGPRSPEGKAVSRFNAIKSGIHAQSQVIPGEDADEFNDLVEGYRQDLRPANHLESFLVDELVNADWLLRRLRKMEAHLWGFHTDEAKEERDGIDEDYPLGHVFNRALDAFTRLQRRIDAAQRAYYRALKYLQALQAGRARGLPVPGEPEIGFVPSQSAPPSGSPDPPPAAPAASANPPAHTEIAAAPVQPQLGGVRIADRNTDTGFDRSRQRRSAYSKQLNVSMPRPSLLH